ncbi:MAG: hypothetical protein C0501_16845 [Isosphaera sp.]|nr:hypothetical protein [Isosphaera sp.]
MTHPRLTTVALAVSAALAAGCGGGGPDLPELHPVKGTVRRGGQPVTAGSVQFATDPPNDLMVTGAVGPDGTYTLSTARMTDKTPERKPGAPAGVYRVTYTPPLGDQTAGGDQGPIPAGLATVTAGPNDIPVDVRK